mgnify:CR=1 FL=1
MYYPYLRARQFELIALRELAKEGKLNNIVPILEPVKTSFNNFKLAFDVFFKNNIYCYIILNPSVGDTNTQEILNFLNSYDTNLFKPALISKAAKTDNISQFIEENECENYMLIFNSNLEVNQDFLDLINSDVIESVCVEDPNSNRSLDRSLKGLNVNYIRLDDEFPSEKRNSNYLEILSRKFSEEHRYFNDENYDGFSNYTVLSSSFQDGGGPPRAVVIHLTYFNNQNNIWISHFTSDSNDSISNIQGKFAQASSKAVDFIHQQGLEINSALQELINYVDEQHYPGLGVVKKISIKNHILLLSSYLNR